LPQKEEKKRHARFLLSGSVLKEERKKKRKTFLLSLAGEGGGEKRFLLFPLLEGSRRMAMCAPRAARTSSSMTGRKAEKRETKVLQLLPGKYRKGEGGQRSLSCAHTEWESLPLSPPGRKTRAPVAEGRKKIRPLFLSLIISSGKKRATPVPTPWWGKGRNGQI